MAERLEFDAPLSRRRALGLGAAVVASTVLPTTAAASPRAVAKSGPRPQASTIDALRPTIRPRSDWAGDLAPTGALAPEDDVRFLLVHHTASTNDYGPDDVANQIRGWFEFHTSAEKGWPDIAYNFLIDRFGGIWEGREGSLDGPVRGDATGGSQGFALLCSLIGDYAEAEMTSEQQAALTQLLAWLAETHSIDTAPEAQVSFVSRGSNLWAAGAEVTASTISGHRDMSSTSCPGDFVYPLLAATIPNDVSRLRLEAGGAATNAETTTAPVAETDQNAASSSTEPTTPQNTAGSTPTTPADDALAAGEQTGDGSSPLVIGGAIAGAAVAGAGLVGLLRASHRARTDEQT